MSDSRLPSRRPPPPGARFRCAACARFVTAGPSGLCPTCGYAPPMPLLPGSRGSDLGERRLRRWHVIALLLLAVLAALAAVR